MEEPRDKDRRAVRIGAYATLIIGIALSTALVAYHNVAAVGRAVWRIGWGLGLIIFLHLTAVVLCGIAWRWLFPSSRAAETRLLVVLRWVRESINGLLPVARVGGDIAGVRLLAARGIEISLASASVVVDRTVEVLSLFLFVLTGAYLLMERGVARDLAHYIVPGLCAIFALLVVLLSAQRWGLLKFLERAVRSLAGKCGAKCDSNSPGVYETVWAMYRSYWRLAGATLLHFLGWVLGVAQLWVALYLMGYPTGWAEVFIIESLCQIICTAAFVMPAALGAQEAAYMTAGGLFGIPPEIGLALSLVKRLGDVTAGVPGLIAWQGFEGRQLWALIKG